MALSECFFKMDVSGQAEKGRLSMKLAKEAVVVTLSVQKSIDDLSAPFSAAVHCKH